MNAKKILKILVILLVIFDLSFLIFKLINDKKEENSRVSIPKHEIIKENTSTDPNWKSYDTPISFPILMYHHISEVVDGNTLFVPPEEFKEQMQALHDEGYYTLSPDEALRVLSKNEKPADKIVWITLDDSYVDNMKNAKPILDQLKMKATINIIFNMKDGVDKMTDAELVDINKDPLISLESHSMDHPDLEYSDVDTALYQLQASKDGLDNLLGQNTSVFTYPSGRYNNQTPELLATAGYKMGLTTNEGLAQNTSPQSLYTLNRVRIAYGNTKDEFLKLVKNGVKIE